MALNFYQYTKSADKYGPIATPEPVKAKEPGLLGNMGRSAGSGALSAVGGIFDFVGANGIAKQFYGWSDDARQSMSAEAQADMAKPFFSENDQGEIQLGEGLTDLDTWLLTLANVAGQAAPTMIPGAGIGSAATKALQLGANGAKWATAAGMGATGGAAATGQGMEQARQEWMQMPDELKLQSDLFKNTIREMKQQQPELDGEALWAAAENNVAERLAAEVQADPNVLIANFAGSAIADPIIGRALTGARLAKSGAFRSALHGFAIEGGAEAGQAAVQEYGINQALSQIDGRDPMDGVAVAALNEGVAGGTLGGAAGLLGGFANRKQEEPVRDKDADAIRDKNPDLASAFDSVAQSSADRQADLDAVITGLPAISQPVLEGELLGTNVPSTFADNQRPLRQQRPFTPYAGQIEDKNIIFAADGRTEAERNPAMEGEWLSPEQRAANVSGFIENAPIDLESEQVKQAKAEMERMRNQPRQITDKNVIFAGDGRPQQAAQEYVDNLQRQANQAASVPRLPQKDIIFAGDQSGVRVKGNGEVYKSAREAMTSKQARAMKRSGTPVEAVQFGDGWGWRVKEAQPEQQAGKQLTLKGGLSASIDVEPAPKAFSSLVRMEHGEPTAIVARSADGLEIGRLTYMPNGGPIDVFVKEDFRRKGVATALYDELELRGGKIPPMSSGVAVSSDAEAFRANRLKAQPAPSIEAAPVQMKKSGDPFKSEKEMKISASYKAAAATGAELETVPVDGGFGFRVKAPVTTEKATEITSQAPVATNSDQAVVEQRERERIDDENRIGKPKLKERIESGALPVIDYDTFGDGTTTYFAKGIGGIDNKWKVKLELTKAEAKLANQARADIDLSDTPEEVADAKRRLSEALLPAAKRALNSDQAAVMQSPETDTAPQTAQGVQARPAQVALQTFEDDDGTLYRVEGVDGNYVSLTRNPDMLSEKRIKVPKSQYEKYYPTAPKLSTGTETESTQQPESIKWFGTQDKADAWVAKQADPASYRVEQSGKGRFEIYQDGKSASKAPAQRSSKAVQDFIDGKRDDVPTVEEVETEQNAMIGKEWDSPFGRQRIKGVFGGDLYEVETVGTGVIRRYGMDRIQDVMKQQQHQTTPEYQAEKAQDEEIAQIRERKRLERIVKEAKSEKEIEEFGSSIGLSPMHIGSAKSTLARDVNNARYGMIMPRKEFIERLVEDGATARLSGSEIVMPDGRFYDSSSLTKVGIDYANYLIAKKARQASQPKPSESKLDKAADNISDAKKAAALKLKKLIDSRKGQLNSGVDPEVLLAVAEVGALSIAEGAVKFAQWVRDVMSTTRAVGIRDEDVKPFLKEAYGAMYANPEKYGISDDIADQMDNPRDARRIDIDSLAGNGDTDNEFTKLGTDGREASEGVSTESVQEASRNREAERSPAQSGASDVSRDQRTGGSGLRSGRGMDNGEGESPSTKTGSSGRLNQSAGTSPAPQMFTITAETGIGQGGAKTKFKNNIAAIRILKQLEQEGRHATPEEQSALALYVGWGGIPQAFYGSNNTASNGWEKEAAELKALLTEDEYSAARRSTQDAHYTSFEIVNAMWSAVRQFGFTGGKVLEPSVGSGNFIGLMPTSERSQSQIVAAELDHITGGIAKLLYPGAKIQAPKGFQDVTLPDNHFDLAIGNPPFGSQSLYDGKRKHLSKFSIHNYFFAKSLDAVAPNGVLAMVVSNFLLDANSTTARQYLADRAELIGAIRLPNNAFSKNAGTEVTTDIIFLRKLREGESSDQSWVKTGMFIDQNGKQVPLNNYFIENPGMMLGEFGAYGSMYSPDSPALVAKDGQDTQALLSKAISRLPKSFMDKPGKPVKQDYEVSTTSAENVKVGSMFIKNGAIHIRQEDSFGDVVSEPVTFPNEKAKERVTGLVKIRDVFAELRKAQLSENVSDATLAKLRKELNKVYDDFVKANGPINADANKRLFRDDPSWPQVAALEDSFDKGITATVAKTTGEKAREPSAKKAAVFTTRTQSPYKPPVAAKNAVDALSASLSEVGRVDLALMSKLYGKPEETILSELKDLVFEASPGVYQTRDEYLSGNVRVKLAEAEKLAGEDKRFARNVEALRSVQPADIEAVDIDIKPGAPWLPESVMSKFAQSILGDEHATMRYNPFNASWSISGRGELSAEKQYGTDRIGAAKIVEAAANQKQIIVRDTVGETSVVNEQATTAANEKVEKVKSEFKSWVWDDDDRRSQLSRTYNDTYNTNVARKYDGSHLTFPGKVDTIKLRTHQANAVWRMMQSGTTLLDHVVGAGKTFTVIAGAMEMRRTGRAKKPMIVVPNHLVDQWAEDFIKLYPGANVLMTTKKDFEKANRKRLFARIATGDWDAVIVAHSSFGKVEMDPEFEAEFIKQQVQDMEVAIQNIRAIEGKKTQSIKQIEKQKERLQEKLKKLFDSQNKDDNLTFGELGVDALFLDEAHEFKNLGFATGMTRVAGLGNPTGSQKAADMFMKVRYVLEQTGGNNVVFATGTPISNTMAELYTMQRYLDYPMLQQQGIAHFDAWARMFGEVVSDWELSPSGAYKLNSRFAKFVNLPELMQRYLSFADVVNRDDVKLPTPQIKTGKPINVVVDRSPDQAYYIGEPVKNENGEEEYPEGSLIWRSEHIPKRPQKGDDNMLSIMSDARKAALDMRMIDQSYDDYSGSKTNKAAGEIMRLYKKFDADKGTQLVFIDLSTPKGAKAKEQAELRELIALADEGDEKAIAKLDNMSPDELAALDGDFSVYDDLKLKLIKKGIPESEIAFIHDAKTELQKGELFGKVKSGRVRVLLGSTAKMGAGMNVQERLVALHHLDAPWRPSDLEQREGRIIRQGNKLAFNLDGTPVKGFEIEILRYATKNTLDSRMWQTIESKARFIEQVRKGNTQDRSIEDVGGEAANAAEMKAASSGNPLILEEMDLRQKIRKLEQLQSEHNREQFSIRDNISRINKRLPELMEEAKKIEKDAAVPVPSDFTIKVGGTNFDKRAEAGESLKSLITKAKDGDTIAAYAGFRVSVHRVKLSDDIYLKIEGHASYEIKVKDPASADPGGLITRITNAISRIPEELQYTQDEIKRFQRELPKLIGQQAAFAKTEELAALKVRHSFVIDELKPKSKAPQQDAGNTSNIKFSKQNTIKAKPAKGVNSRLAKQFVNGIMQRLNGAAGIKVVVLETQAEAEKLWQMSLSGDLVRGAYNRATNTAYVIAENIKSMDELREVVAHEVIGHGGLQNVISKADYKTFIERLKQTRNNRAFAEQWAQIDNDYKGFSENDKAEELFAYFVQNKPVTGPVKFWWNALKRWLHKALVSVGLAKAGDPDVEAMQDMLESIMLGFKNGQQPRNNMEGTMAFSRDGVTIPDGYDVEAASPIQINPAYLESDPFLDFDGNVEYQAAAQLISELNRSGNSIDPEDFDWELKQRLRNQGEEVGYLTINDFPEAMFINSDSQIAKEAATALELQMGINFSAALSKAGRDAISEFDSRRLDRDLEKGFKTLVEARNSILKNLNSRQRSGNVTAIKPGIRFSKSSGMTEAFKRWFNGSKVVDESGKPLVVYHGTNAGDISEFKKGHSSVETDATVGIYFSDSAKNASTYAERGRAPKSGGKAVYPVFLSIKNPLTIDLSKDEGANWSQFVLVSPDVQYDYMTRTATKLSPEQKAKIKQAFITREIAEYLATQGGKFKPSDSAILERDINRYMEKGAVLSINDAAAIAKGLGYDGLIVKGVADSGKASFKGKQTTYVAFESAQIKSAIGNNGDFDPSNPDIRFSKTRTTEQADALDKLGLGEEAAETVAEQAKRRVNETVDTLKSSSFWKRLNEGIFDGLAGIKQAEEAAGVTDPNKQGYVSARLASGLSDILHGVFHYGAPEWRDGVVQRKADTKGLLEVFGMLGDDLNDWLAWMGANRAERLMAEGRENNLSQADIDELKAMAAGKEALFEQVRQEYNKINSAIIDLAEDAGLISAEQRGGFDEEWYVPFFRNMEEEVDPEMVGIAAMVHGPRNRKGIAGQSAQIKELKGGRQSTKDLLENIIHRQSTMIDAAIKNKAMVEVVSNLEGTPFMQAVDSPDIAALSQTELNLLQKVKVMRNGKAEAYTVTDPALLRGLLQIHTIGNNSLFNRMARSAKRFLTAGITLSPDFIIKNFVRDAAHAWMINKDGFRFGADSVKGLRKAFVEDEAYRDLIFSGAAFQGGYVHGADPEAAAQQIRRALRSKGLGEKDIQSYMDSLITKGGELLEAYRTASDKVENANRLSTYEVALAAGKSRKQAAYEAKDLMDYSLKGNFAMIGTMIDMLPFFNARLQGMSKLVRSMKGADGDRVLKVLSANLAMKGLKVAAFSLALAAMNDDDERYQELPDWDKDANWHFFIGDEHFRIPKPFELGIIFGTMPERMFHYAAGNQPGGDLGKAAAHAVWNTLALNPIPQLALPVVEVMTNKSFFKGSQIEGMGDAQRQPEDRYNAYTSETAKQIGAAFGVSPKMVEHLILGYTGTLGGYVLGMADIAARQMLGIEAADTPISRYPVIKAFYQGDAPKTATKFQDEFYKALEESTEAYGSYKRAVEEGDVVRQQDLKESESQALGARVQLSRIQRRLSELNKQAEMVNNNQSLSGAEKRQKLDDIAKRKNALYQNAYVRHKLGEW